MVNLGQLTKLLDQGYTTTDFTFDSDDGSFVFNLKTISPKETVQAKVQAQATLENSGSKDDLDFSTFLAGEVLARAVRTVNDVPFSDVPGATGKTTLEKTRSLIEQFSQKLLLDLWTAYNGMIEDTTLEDTEEDEAELKK